MDGTAFTVFPADSASLPVSLRHLLSSSCDGTVPFSGSLYMKWNKLVLCCPDTDEGRSFLDLIRQKAVPAGHSLPQSDDLWIRFLNREPVTDAENRFSASLSCLAGELNVLFFRSCADRDIDHGQLQEILPLEPNDIYVQYSRDSFVIIRKEKRENESRDFAAAVIDTVNTETGIILKAGIGRTYEGAAHLPDSFSEAELALRTGERFHLPDTVFPYEALKVERIVDAIPENRRNLLLSEYLNTASMRFLTDEMLETTETFFRNDLNLSNTARELFIHRNTLQYRLDRIRKGTGLDVRNFHDALVFRILIGILRADAKP